MKLRSFHLVAFAAALALPLLITVLIGLGRLLAALGDAGGALGVDRAALATGVAWIMSLIGMVVLNSLLLHANADNDVEPPSGIEDDQ